MSDKNSSYGNIFKTTFLFGFVQVARLLVGVIKNKIVAVLLGPDGIGIISIYTNIINTIKTGASLGINQSAVKDVSEAVGKGDVDYISKIISVTNRVVIWTSCFGLIITLLLSKHLSNWGFSDNLHTYSFCLLSVSVAFEIFTDNQLAILKGMRHLKELAKATLFGAIVSLVTGVPFILILGETGIVPSIIISSMSTAVIAVLFIKKIKYDRIRISVSETIINALPMIRMGIVLMLSNFLSYFFNFIVLGYIQKSGGLADVGYYNAGCVLVVSYFSMVTTALNTDYYPRIASRSSDNMFLADELYKQSKVGILLMFPLVVLFTLLSPLLIRILYSRSFEVVLLYTDIAIFGTLISVISNCLGYIFIVKQDSKLYLGISIIFNVLYIPIFILLYKYLGLVGLGLAYLLNVMGQLLVYWFCSWKKYKISIDFGLLMQFFAICLIVILTIFIRRLVSPWNYFLGLLISGLVVYYTVKKIGAILGDNVFNILMKKYGRKQ